MQKWSDALTDEIPLKVMLLKSCNLSMIHFFMHSLVTLKHNIYVIYPIKVLWSKAVLVISHM